LHGLPALHLEVIGRRRASRDPHRESHQNQCTINCPHSAATPTVSTVPELKARKSLSIPSENTTPFSGMCDSSRRLSSPPISPNTSRTPLLRLNGLILLDVI